MVNARDNFLFALLTLAGDGEFRTEFASRFESLRAATLWQAWFDFIRAGAFPEIPEGNLGDFACLSAQALCRWPDEPPVFQTAGPAWLEPYECRALDTAAAIFGRIILSLPDEWEGVVAPVTVLGPQARD